MDFLWTLVETPWTVVDCRTWQHPKADSKVRKVNLSPEEEQARQVLNVTMRLLGLTDANVGEPIGRKYQWVQQRRR